MIEGLKLPVGIEDFQEIRKAGFYYVDKTQLIEQLIEGWYGFLQKKMQDRCRILGCICQF